MAQCSGCKRWITLNKNNKTCIDCLTRVKIKKKINKSTGNPCTNNVVDKSKYCKKHIKLLNKNNNTIGCNSRLKCNGVMSDDEIKLGIKKCTLCRKHIAKKRERKKR